MKKISGIKMKLYGKMAVTGVWLAVGVVIPPTAKAQTVNKPNILVIFGDDIGQTNISAYTHGLVGYETPNIDRVAKEGIMFNDYYAENSCTAGRSTFITGQSCYRTGLSKVGMPGVDIGLQARDITIAQALKPLGYATGQFGKNHLGDLNKYLPTVHGFDEFFGNLYHLNAEEEPEDPTYPYQDSAFARSYMVRGVLKCKATNVDDPTVDPRFGKVGKQKIEDSGPLTKKRMETIDDETFAAAIDFIKRQNAAGKPFFCWMNATRMHAFTHVRASMIGQSGMPGNEYADGMLEHDADVGLILKALDDLGITDNTIVIYTTDNGPNMFSWPDAAMSPFRSEKDANWEGAFRVPAFIRWPGHIAAGKISNEIMSGLDWFPTILAAAGDTTIKEKLLTGYQSQGTNFKVHLDGFNQLPYLTGKQKKSARTEFYYFNDDAVLVSMRMNDWKIVFQEQRMPGGFAIWANPFTPLRVPKLFHLRMDPYERADITSFVYEKWWATKMFIVAEGIQKGAIFLQSFVTYPPSQDPASFSIDAISGRVKDQIKMLRAQQNAIRK